MKAPEIVRKALRSVLMDVNATEAEQRQAEALLDSLVQSAIDKQDQKPLPCEAGLVKCEAMMDQLWRNVEQRHFAQLKEIVARQSLLMTKVELDLAIVCIGMVYTTIGNAQSRRTLDAIKNEQD